MLNEIINITYYSELTALLEIENPAIAKAARTGHFVIVRLADDGLRIPFTIITSNPEAGTIGILIHRAAGLGDILKTLSVGYVIPDVLGPLGQALEIKKTGLLLCVGDGAGFVPLLPVIHAYKECGTRVVSVFSETSAQTTCLMPLITAGSEPVESGEEPVEAVVARLIDELHPDAVIMSGPTMMMKKLSHLTSEAGIPARVILNMMMIDGIGLCGICRVMVDGKRKLTCIDGPAFDAAAVDYDQLQNRQRHFV